MQKTAVEKEYEAIAPRYDARWESYSRTTHQMAIKLLSEQKMMSILDISGGTGSFAERMTSMAGGKVTILDISEGMIEQAEERFKGVDDVTVVHGDAHAFDLGKTFSSIVCLNAFHMYERPDRVLHSAQRHLGPGGEIVIIDWCRDPLYFKIFDRVWRRVDKTHQKSHTVAEIRDSLSHHGFDVMLEKRFRHKTWSLMGIKAVKQ